MELSVQYICATLLAVFCLCHIGAMGQLTKISENEKEVVFQCVTVGSGTTQFSVTGCDIDAIQLLSTDFTTGGASDDCYNDTIGLNATATSLSTDNTSYVSSLTIQVTNLNITIEVRCLLDFVPVGEPMTVKPSDRTPAVTTSAPSIGMSTISPTSDLTPGSTTTAGSAGLSGGVTAAVVVVVLVAILTVTSIIVVVVTCYICKKRRRSKVNKKLNKTAQHELIEVDNEGGGDGVCVKQQKVETGTGKKKPEANGNPELQTEGEEEKEKERLQKENQELRTEVNDLRIKIEKLQSQRQRDNSELQRKDSELQEKEANEKRLISEIEFLRNENSSLHEEVKKLKAALKKEEDERKQKDDDLQGQITNLASMFISFAAENANDTVSRGTFETKQHEENQQLNTAQNKPDTGVAVALSPDQSLVAEVLNVNEHGESPASEGEGSPASESEERVTNGSSAQCDPVSKDSAKTEYPVKHLKDGASGVDSVEELVGKLSSLKGSGALNKNGHGLTSLPDQRSNPTSSDQIS